MLSEKKTTNPTNKLILSEYSFESHICYKLRDHMLYKINHTLHTLNSFQGSALIILGYHNSVGRILENIYNRLPFT